MTAEQTDKIFPLFPPPLFYGGILLIGLGLNIVFPLKIFSSFRAGLFLGLIFILFGALLVIWAVKTLFKRNVDPRFKPVGNIVTEGPYAFTRNPMYVSFTLIYAGFAFLFNALWPLFFLPLVLVVMTYGVIKREERYLEKRFGEEYLKYASEVRRWI